MCSSFRLGECQEGHPLPFSNRWLMLSADLNWKSVLTARACRFHFKLMQTGYL
ncbi:unnamed protein product [Ixodes pacificus]